MARPAAVVLLAALAIIVAVSATGSPFLGSAFSAGAVDAGAPVIPILFPMLQRVAWEDTWGAPRSGGRSHEGNDLLVPKMTKLVAVVDGKLDWMNFDGKLSSYNGLPYYNLLLRGDDGNDYFYIHLNNDTPGTDDGKGGTANAYAPGLTNGTHVKAGRVIGYAGDSGNAEDTASHLHFEIHRGGYKNPIDPYPSLKAAMTYDEWVVAGGGPLGTAPGSTTTTSGSGATTTTKPPTTTTTKPPTTTTTESVDPGPGGQLDPGAPPFDDVKTSDWFYEDLATVYAAGVVNGSGGVFRPYGRVTRAQFAAFLVRGFAPASLEPAAPTHPVFTDVPPSFWGYKEIAAAAESGLVRGTGDGTRFAPNALITRAQMATMIFRALGVAEQASRLAAVGDDRASRVFPDVPVNYWAAGEIAEVQSLGLVTGGSDGRFRPEESTNRAQAVTVIARALRLTEGGEGG